MNILVVGKAKTGTTIISKTIQNSIPCCRYHLEPKTALFFEDDRSLAGSNVVKIIFEHWNKKSNLRNAIFKNEYSFKLDKFVGIIRDPRDEMISRFFYVIRFLVKEDPDIRKFRKWVEIIVEKERNPKCFSFLKLIEKLNVLYGSSFDPKPQYGYYEFLKRNNIFVIRYEDFIDGNFVDLENYLKIKLRYDGDVGLLDYTKRTANYNNWKAFFTEEDIDYFKSNYDFYSSIGYTDWKLDDPSYLNSEFGSKYIQNLCSICGEDKGGYSIETVKNKLKKWF